MTHFWEKGADNWEVGAYPVIKVEQGGAPAQRNCIHKPICFAELFWLLKRGIMCFKRT